MTKYLATVLLAVVTVFISVDIYSEALAQGEAQSSIFGDFEGREYILERSPVMKKGRARQPLVIFLHGGFGNASGVQGVLSRDMRAVMRRGGFMVAYLNGTSIGIAPRRKKWNAGECCGRGSYRRNDVQYIQEFIQYAVKQYGADRKRIYLMGHSNGGMMTYRYICQVKNSVAAAVIVSGALTTERCSPSGVRGILHIHGREDDRVDIEGGPARFRGARGLRYRSLRYARRIFRDLGTPFQTRVLGGIGHGLREVNYDVNIPATAWRFFRNKRLR